MKVPVLVVALLLLAQLCYIRGQTYVDCFDQQEVCECPEKQKVCEFKLEIEELQTFTSYQIKDKDLLSRGTPGDTYYMTSAGYLPAVPNRDIPERGPCYLNSSFNPIVYDRHFTNQGCSIPMTVDGTSYRMFLAVNGRIPGPTLIMDEDSLVKVQVVNRLTSEAVTIHWHGMHQRGTPWMDGVGFISQAPISAGASFDYVFRATPAGTHWYHSHVGAQRTDGLFGALIVREKGKFFRDVVTPLIRRSPEEQYQTIYDVPDVHTLTLLDWQREASLDLFVKIHSTLGFYPGDAIGVIPRMGARLYNRTMGPDNIEVGPIPYWSGLINGRGRFDFSDTTTNLAPLSVFPVTRDSANRFRLIGAQSLFAYSFSIDNHQLRIIATDGHFVTPREVDYIIVHSGERYDFIVDTFDQQDRLFWMRAETLEVLSPTDRQHAARAVLSYGNSQADVDWTNGYSEITSVPRTCSEAEPCVVLNCPFGRFAASEHKQCLNIANLTSLFEQPQEKLPKFVSTMDCVDCLKFFNFGFEGESTTSAVNGWNFKLPVTPYQTNCGQYENDVAFTNDTCSSRPPPREDRALEDRRCINVVRIVQQETFAASKDPKTVVMVFSAVGLGTLRDFAHPIHIHGHSFHILHVGHGEYDEMGRLNTSSPDVTCNNDRACRNPSWASGTQLSDYIQQAMGIDDRINNRLIRKDTVMVPAGGYVVVAFRADNPGYWFLHCHIEVHQLEGMGVLIEEYPYRQHVREPAGINAQGNFRWSLSEFTNFVGKGATCGAGGNGASLSILLFALLTILQ